VVDEVLDRPVRREDAQRAVGRPDEIAGGGDDAVEHRDEREIGGDDPLRLEQPL
jgi:hypothetical protein